MTLHTLDTNVVSAIIRGDERVMAQVETRVAAGHDVMLNAISYYETRRGLTPQHARKRARFEVLILETGILDLDRAAPDTAASLYQDLRRKSTPLEDADILIAGIALANDATLVTRNIKHFERVEGLGLEDWET